MKRGAFPAAFLLALLGATTVWADGDSVARVREDLRRSPPTTAGSYRAYLDRFAALPGEEAKAERMILLHDYLDGPGAGDAAARRSLDAVDFRRLERQVEPVPRPPALFEERRRLEHVEALAAFHEERWLDDPSDVALALEALRALDRDARRRARDPVFRLGVRAQANFAADPVLGPYVHVSRWVPPFLVVYTTGERMTDHDVQGVAEAERRRLVDRHTALDDEAQPVLDEYAELLTALTEEFYARYGPVLGVKPLASLFGGREDYPPGIRSFHDGAVLRVVVFRDDEAPTAWRWQRPLDAWEAAEDHADSTGAVYLRHPAAAPRARRHEALLSGAARSLLDWSVRQRNRWARPGRGPDWLRTGFSAWMSGTRRSEGRIEFTGVPGGLLDEMRTAASDAARAGREYPFLPLERLVAFSSPVVSLAVAPRMRETAQAELHRQQCWALVLFLNEHADGKYRRPFLSLLDAHLSREPGARAFAKLLDLDTEDAWRRLEEEFRGFVREDLLR